VSEIASSPADCLPDIAAVADWEDPPRAAASGAAPMLSVAGFEGPLDWLLEMARAKKIDLARLPIADLIQCFVDAFEAALGRAGGIGADLELWGAWLVMAATLTDLRSRLLLPVDAPEARQALSEADALRRQILCRAEMRAAADWLEQREQLGRDVFACGRPETGTPRRSTDITDLLRACLTLLRVPADVATTYQPRPPPFWLMSDAIARIQAMIAERPDGGTLRTFLPHVDAKAPDRERRCRAAVASTLLAGLELARQGDIALDQEMPWASIAVHPRERTVADQEAEV
jgi:segregation and condensation protein A